MTRLPTLLLFVVFTAAAEQPAGYADPKLCAGCHPAIAKTYRQNGMGRSFSTPRPEILIEDFTKNNRYYHAASDTWFEMLRRDGKLIHRRYQIGFEGRESNVEEKEVDYVVGSGNHMRTYLHRNSDGTLVELPLAWYAEKGGYWAMNPGYDTADYPYERRPVSYDCMFCHNAYPKTPAAHDRLGDLPVYSGAMPEGIDCQRCHGPGLRHVDVASKAGAAKEAIRAAIVNPARLIPDLQVEVCAQCHLKITEFRLPHAIKRYDRADFSYRPGEPLASFLLAFDEQAGAAKSNRFETASAVARMRESQCFLKSKGALTCSTCHNPHDVRHGAEAVDRYNAVCRQCHAATFTAAVANGKHTAATACIDCHMPKRRTEDIVHIVTTDHLIQRRKPAGDLLADLAERHESDATAYRGEVVPYYPNPLPHSPENDYYVALAQVQDRANLKQGLPRLERAIAAWQPRRPEPWFELAAARRASGDLPDAIAALREALRRDPAYLPALLELAGAYRESGQPALRVATAKRATETAPEDARTWNALGQAALDLGQFQPAIDAFTRAVAIDAEMPEAHNGIGVARAQLGDAPAAEAEFREAVRDMPNYGEARGNLANLLAWKQDFRQAGFEFEKAVHLSPRDAAARFNYGSMLNSLRRYEEARLQLAAAVDANPAFAEAHDLLGTVYERQGQGEAALREYREAVRLRPELGHAQLDLGAVLANRGERAQAVEHLRAAAKSPDKPIRELAEKLLQGLGATPDSKN